MSKKNIEDIYPLSAVQQGILFHSLSAPESGTYVEQLVCTLSGDLDVDAFERAWAAVLAGHAVLRTLFVWNRREKPLQIVRRNVSLPFEQYDWRDLSHAEQGRRLDALLDKDRRRGFNLSEAPLMRLALVRTGTERFQLLWTSHHLVLDGWSLPLVLKEVFDFYEAFHQGRELRLRPVRPFRDYVAWLKRQDLSQAEQYWRETLKGFTQPTPLISDQLIHESRRGRPAFAEQEEKLPSHLTNALQSLARQHHLTLSTLAQAAWALLLSRYSGESDVVFGVTVSGRAGNVEGVESMIGLLINTLPLRVRVVDEEPVLSWLKEVQRRQGELIQYEYSPLAQVRAWSDVPRGTDLFHSLYVFENYPLDAAAFGRHDGIRIVDVRALEQNNYPLTIAVMPGAEMSLHMAYDTRRFDAATVTRMLGHMRTLLEGVVLNPNRRIGELPLTLNGKVDRLALPPPDRVRSELEPDFLPPRNESERILAEIWSRALGVERVGINDNFFELGGDSITSLQIVGRASQAGLVITPGQLFQHPTIAALAQVADITPSIRAEQGTITGPVPLTPIQCWFFEQNLPAPHHYNQAVMLEVREGVDVTVLEEALAELMAHHDALRMRFAEGESGWQQINAASEDHKILTQIDLSTVSLEEHAIILETANASLNLSEGPLIRVLYLKDESEKPGRLLILAHHLVIDAVSWRILIEDLDQTYKQLAQHLKANLPLKTTSFKEWAGRVCEYAQCDDVRREMEYWTAEARCRAGVLPVDGDGEVAPADSIFVSLSADETHQLLHRTAADYHARIDEMLLSALALTLERWSGSQRLLIDVEGHGREDLCSGLDLSRTVGWFTTVFPVLLELGESVDELEALKVIKEQLRAIPARGIGYGLLRYLRRDENLRERLRTMPQAEVSFNYLGHLDHTLDSSSIFSLVNEPVGPARSRHQARSHAIEVEACIFEGQLRVEWSYCRQTHSRSTVERLATAFITHLRTLVQRHTAERAQTPSDFPLANLDQARLAQITATSGVVQDIYPLTALQQGMLFHELYEPRGNVYHTQLVCDLNSPLDERKFRGAWQAVVDRHAVLRTDFEWEALEEPLQVVRQDVSLRIDEEDWRDIRESERAARLDNFLQADRERGYTLSEAPLMRLKLFRTGEADYVLVWSCNHLLLDGWSLAILLKEFLNYYEVLCRGEVIESTAEQPYRAYIEWLRQRDEKAAETYWRQALRGIRQPTQFGVQRANEVGEEHAHGEQVLHLNRYLTGQLRDLARTSGLTLNTLMRGAWAILLSRYSRETDVLFGTVISGRPGELPGVEEMVGMFINTLLSSTVGSEAWNSRDLKSRPH